MSSKSRSFEHQNLKNEANREIVKQEEEQSDSAIRKAQVEIREAREQVRRETIRDK